MKSRIERGLDTSMKYSFWGIIATMVLLPNTMNEPRNMFIIATFILLYILWMMLNRKIGYSLVLLSIIMCYPLVFAKFEVTGPNYLLTIYRIGMVLVLIAQLSMYKKVFRYPTLIFLGVAYAVLYVIYGIFVPTDRLFYNAVHFLLYIAVPFIICNNEQLNSDDVYKGFSLIIIITCVYAVLQFHNIYCPYSNIYSIQNLELEEYFRARGLLGNSLILMGALVFYQALCFIRLLSSKRINYLVEALVLYTALITLSRSVIIIILLQLLLYLYFSKASIKVIVVVGVSFMIVFLGDLFFKDLFNSITERFIQGQNEIASSDFHRTAAVTSTWNLLQENILGVGPSGVSKAMHHYASSGLRQDFTLDNIFLKHIASFGILAFIPLAYIFYLYFYAYKKRKLSPIFFKSVFYMMVSFALVGFSFCADNYPQMTGIFYGCLGYIFLNKKEFVNQSILGKRH